MNCCIPDSLQQEGNALLIKQIIFLVSVFGKPFHEDDAPNYFVLPPSGVKQGIY